MFLEYFLIFHFARPKKKDVLTRAAAQVEAMMTTSVPVSSSPHCSNMLPPKSFPRSRSHLFLEPPPFLDDPPLPSFDNLHDERVLRAVIKVLFALHTLLEEIAAGEALQGWGGGRGEGEKS